jgi:hypothetical protein
VHSILSNVLFQYSLFSLDVPLAPCFIRHRFVDVDVVNVVVLDGVVVVFVRRLVDDARPAGERVEQHLSLVLVTRRGRCTV